MSSKLGLLARLAIIRPRFAVGYLIVVAIILLAFLAPVHALLPKLLFVLSWILTSAWIVRDSELSAGKGSKFAASTRRLRRLPNPWSKSAWGSFRHQGTS